MHLSQTLPSEFVCTTYPDPGRGGFGAGLLRHRSRMRSISFFRQGTKTHDVRFWRLGQFPTLSLFNHRSQGCPEGPHSIHKFCPQAPTVLCLDGCQPCAQHAFRAFKGSLPGVPPIFIGRALQRYSACCEKGRSCWHASRKTRLCTGLEGRMSCENPGPRSLRVPCREPDGCAGR